MTDKTNRLTKDQFIAARQALGPTPSKWRPFARRRWYAAEMALLQRYDGYEETLARVQRAIDHYAKTGELL